jgi:hypothetical protein
MHANQRVAIGRREEQVRACRVRNFIFTSTLPCAVLDLLVDDTPARRGRQAQVQGARVAAVRVF